MPLRSQAISFAKHFLHVLFELRDFDAGLAMLSTQVSWFGTSKSEVCHDFQDAIRLLSALKQADDSNPHIVGLWCNATPIDEGSFSILGEFGIVGDGQDNTKPVNFRFTIVCRTESGVFKMLHSHFSIASSVVDSTTLGGDYSLGLENTLRERTQKLNENTAAMQALLASLPGGVVVYHLADDHPITYFNEGFCELTGYSEQDIESLLDNHYMLLVATEYVDYVRQSLQHQLADGDRYEIEYPIICRNGSKLWVLEKGTALHSQGGERVAQSVLTDITCQKQLELELRQQNEALTMHKQLLFEANVTRNNVLECELHLASEINLPSFSMYSDLVRYLAGTLVHPDEHSNVELFFSPRRAVEAMEHGEIQRSIKFRLYSRTGVYRWTQADITSVRDDLSGDIKLRCYLQDINDEKKSFDRSAGNRRILDYVLMQSLVVYEVNLTDDRMISGVEDWEERYGFVPKMRYSEDIESFARTVVHPEDAVDFLRMLRLQSVMAAWDDGRSDLCCEYRKAEQEGDYHWHSFTLHLFQEEGTGELRAVGYVQDIHERKIKQLQLVYNAEHDPMTGLLNKTQFEQSVDDFLLHEGKGGKHAFFIFDLDNFKSINDSLGHAFGDVVLSRTASRAVELFREYDLLGRVGGDEFAVFMKNISNHRVAEAKANELCDKLHEIYNKNGAPFPVSISVGVSFYPLHGLDMRELYTNADVALYAAKEGGRNRSMVYNGTLAMAPSRSTAMDTDDFVNPHSFDRNTPEFIFRILYDTNDKCTAINSVLEIIGKQFGVSRSYIFEEDTGGQGVSNTFEWCSKGVASQKSKLQEVPYITLDEYPLNFNEAGIFYLPKVAEASPNVRHLIEMQSIVSMLQFSIMRDEAFYGFVGFDFCDRTVVPTKSDISVLKTVANMLGVFLVQMRAVEISEKMSNVALSIVDALDSYAYIIDPVTYRLLLINKKTRSISPTTIMGDYCYRSFMGLQSPCHTCPMAMLADKPDAHISVDIVNEHMSKYTRATASWLDWTDGSRVCLMHCIEL